MIVYILKLVDKNAEDEKGLGDQGAAGMERREMLADGFRYLARLLPTVVATAGSLGILLSRPVGAADDHRAACFPAQTEEVVQPTAPPLPKED